MQHRCATILPLLSICETLLSKNNMKDSGHDKVVDRIIAVWFCGPKKYRFFGSQKRSIRNGLAVVRLARTGPIFSLFIFPMQSIFFAVFLQPSPVRNLDPGSHSR